MSGTGTAVVAIGGGHGLAMVLRSVMGWASPLTAIVSVGDDGGSSGRLRAELGIAPPGDVRRCVSALCPDPELADLLEHRFTEGELTGHPVGNLVLAGLLRRGFGVREAVDRLRRWTGVPDDVSVVPSALEPVTLHADSERGPLVGQVSVQHSQGIRRVWITPESPAVDDDIPERLASADLVVLSPGSLYTSTLASLVVPAVRDAVAATSAPVVYVCNLRSVEAESLGYDVAAHVRALADHGVAPDVVLVQEGALPSGDLSWFAGTVRTVHVDRPHGLAHDPDLLGPVLRDLGVGT